MKAAFAIALFLLAGCRGRDLLPIPPEPEPVIYDMDCVNDAYREFKTEMKTCWNAGSRIDYSCVFLAETRYDARISWCAVGPGESE